MIVKRIFDHVIKFKERMYPDFKKQLLIYIRSKEKVGKNWDMKIIKMGFILPTNRKKFVIFTPTGFIANGINNNIVYIIFGVYN